MSSRSVVISVVIKVKLYCPSYPINQSKLTIQMTDAFHANSRFHPAKWRIKVWSDRAIHSHGHHSSLNGPHEIDNAP